ncbi:MAG: Gfo/Idh/MocA family oxidoreductase [Phycisphaeraceae bacterium]
MTDVKANSGSSRRDFIRSSAAVSTAAIAAQLGISSAAHAQGSEEVRVGLIGCGGRGSGAASQALSTAGKVRLVAAADAFEDRLNSSVGNLAKEHKGKVDLKADDKYVGFDAYQKLIDRNDVDMVILATPPGFRPIHFEYAVKKGKHVFMEKPVATDAPGVRTVLAAAEEAKKKGLKVGVGLQRHHQANYIETVKRLQDGAIGRINLLRVYWNNAGVWVRPRQPQQTEMEYQMRNWYYFNWLCGDHINEQHIHNLDVANWVMDAHPVIAQGQGGREVRKGKEYGEIYDHHMVEFTYSDGTKLLSQCRHIRGCWSQVAEFAEGATGKANIGGGNIQQWAGGAPWKATGGKNPYQVEHDDLFDAIRNNKPYNEAFYGATSTMTSILGRMCTYSGKEIKWDDAINSQISLMPEKFAFDAEAPVLPDKDGLYPIAVPGETKVV